MATLQDWYHARLDQQGDNPDMAEAYLDARRDWIDLQRIDYEVMLPNLDNL